MNRRIWAARFVCPSCEVEHFAEYEKPPEIVEPDRLGLAALCGCCEARRRCQFVGEGKPRPFWTEADEASAWLNIRRFPDRYRMQSWETEPHANMLRDDREDEILRLIGIKPRTRGYSVRWKFSWTMEQMAVRGISWPIPPNPQPF